MRKFNWLEFLFAVVMGVLFHFVYDWLGWSFLRLVFPSGESIFEHTKLVTYPMLISFFIFSWKRDSIKKDFPRLVLGILIANGIIISLYYTYFGVFGKNVDFVNIILYFLAMFVAYFYIATGKTRLNFPWALTIIVIFIILTSVFSFYPPQIPFFAEP